MALDGGFFIPACGEGQVAHQTSWANVSSSLPPVLTLQSLVHHTRFWVHPSAGNSGSRNDGPPHAAKK